MAFNPVIISPTDNAPFPKMGRKILTKRGIVASPIRQTASLASFAERTINVQ